MSKLTDGFGLMSKQQTQLLFIKNNNEVISNQDQNAMNCDENPCYFFLIARCHTYLFYIRAMSSLSPTTHITEMKNHLNSTSFLPLTLRYFLFFFSYFFYFSFRDQMIKIAHGKYSIILLGL